MTDQHIVEALPNAREAIDTGTFSLPVDGKEQKVPARYTVVHDLRNNDEGLIIHHHSSAIPEPVTPQE